VIVPGGEAKPITHATEAIANPYEAIAPAIGAITQRAAVQKTHSRPENLPVLRAQDAGIIPRVENERASASQVIDHANTEAKNANAARANELTSDQFTRKLKEAIAQNMKDPATEAEADEVKEQGALKASATLHTALTTERANVTGQLQSAVAANEAPPEGAESAPPLQREALGLPPEPVSAAPVAPQPLPAEQLDFSSDRAATDQAMAQNDITKQQLEEGREPAFTPTLTARAAAERHEGGIQAIYRQWETGERVRTQGMAHQALVTGLAGLHGVRSSQIGLVVKQQSDTATKNNDKRKAITDKIVRMKNDTLDQVNKILRTMDDEAEKLFQAGLDRAEKAYTDAFKEAKGGAWTWLTTWGESWRRHIRESLQAGRDAYNHDVDLAIDAVVKLVDGKLNEAKNCAADGLASVKTFVSGLDDSVKGFAESALREVSDDFKNMVKDIDQRRDGLIDRLAQQHKASYQRMLATEERLRLENRSLWDKIYDATVGLIKKIIAFKDMLLSVLARAVSVIGDIIRHPIRFLENLVSGVGKGISNFIGHIDKHLEKGLITWLFAKTDLAGAELPDKLDFAGISKLVLQTLHIDYGHFRSRAVNAVGEPLVTTMEHAVEVFRIAKFEGIPGLLRVVKEHLSELKGMVLDAIVDFVKQRVFTAGINWILKLLTPASAFFAACKAIYDIVKFFITRASQIADLVNAVIDSVAEIATNNLGSAIARVEGALAKAIPVAIGFLASLIGIGDPAKTVQSIIEKAQPLVDRAIDAVIAVAAKGVRAVTAFASKGVQTATGAVKSGVTAVGGLARRLAGVFSDSQASGRETSAAEDFMLGSESHTLHFRASDGRSRVSMSSDDDVDLHEQVRRLRIHYVDNWRLQRQTDLADRLSARLDEVDRLENGLITRVASGQVTEIGALSQLRGLLSKIGEEFKLPGLQWIPPKHSFRVVSRGSYDRLRQVEATLCMFSYQQGSEATVPFRSIPGMLLGSRYQRGHLVARVLGGHGDTVDNLTPISPATNQNMRIYAERKIWEQLDPNLGRPTFSPVNVIRYNVTAVLSEADSIMADIRGVVSSAKPESTSALFLLAQNNAIKQDDFSKALGLPSLSTVEYGKLLDILKQGFLPEAIQIRAETLQGKAEVGGFYSIENHQ
jgi:hypothetical protein